jgi:hypothetical protein
MANATYTLIQSVTLTTATATITLGSGGTIPQTYTDLKIVISAQSSSASGVPSICYQFNGTTSGYSSRDLYTYNSGTPGSGTFTTATAAGLTMGRWGDGNLDSTSTNAFANIDWYISNYNSSNNKSWLVDAVAEANNTPSELDLIAGLWSNTAAINSITLANNGGNFNQYSSFYLYGIKNS